MTSLARLLVLVVALVVIGTGTDRLDGPALSPRQGTPEGARVAADVVAGWEPCCQGVDPDGPRGLAFRESVAEADRPRLAATPLASRSVAPGGLVAAPTPAPTGSASDVSWQGTASHMGSAPVPTWYLAIPKGPGYRVRLCGPIRCIDVTSTDAGPSLAMQRAGRVADLSVALFERVCGCPSSVGLINVSVTIERRAVLPTLPPTETRP